MKVAVIGAGVMGPGIAQIWLMGGHEVVLTDLVQKALEEGKESIYNSLQTMRAMDIIEKDASQYMSCFEITTSLGQAVKNAKLVIEVVPERMDIKKQVYEDLNKLCDEDAIIVSNTSSLPLPEIFPDFRPGKFFVAHFFNPPQIIPLVELVRNEKTDTEAVEWLKKELEMCGKTPIVVNGFIKGFLVNRMQLAMTREALYLLDKGVVSAADLDKTSMAAVGFKSAWQGMFNTMDFVGLDTVAFVNNIIFPDLCNDTSTPKIVTDKVNEGKLGIKTGEGFYKYDQGKGEEVTQKRQTVLLEQLKLWNKYKPCDV
ncbi:MAG TPA: 3-hydroxyacyl-CoA dehydrogenase family protein [Desulfosporosinus sp.]|nr:3-hydroxyacyl-CoA dehydrogenase family protein [Desulfosporosinus sp.]